MEKAGTLLKLSINISSSSSWLSEVTTGSGCLKAGGCDTPGGKNLSAFFLMEIHKPDTLGKLFLANDTTSDIGRLLLTRSSYRRTVPGLL